MLIDNKFNIDEQVRWGPNTAVITGMRLAGSMTNILYDISYFDVNDVGVMSLVYEIELESLRGEAGMGFHGKDV